MIEGNRAAVMDRPRLQGSRRRLGGPFIVIGLLLVAWVAGRSLLWENPFPVASVFGPSASLFAQAPMLVSDRDDVAARRAANASPAGRLGPMLAGASSTIGFASIFAGQGTRSPLPLGPAPMHMAAGHDMLWHAALNSDVRGVGWYAGAARGTATRRLQQRPRTRVPVFPGKPPFARGSIASQKASRPDRWSLGAWVFGREAPGGLPLTAGPAPVYGASQAGANLQHRIAPGNARDPRAYLRATRALIDSGETELAAGLSARPVARLPLRLAAELRATENPLGRDFRPAAFAITELPAIALPAGLSAEVYGAAGYVGGDAASAFVDGQASVTRAVTDFDIAPLDGVRVSLGAGAWGGAQRGVHRIDVGPTLRMDMMVGVVPARVSIDYREQVAGDASPASGLAATLSTQF